jgi:hypothetical protein
MISKSEGTTAIGNLTGTKLRGRVIDVVEALLMVSCIMYLAFTLSR